MKKYDISARREECASTGTAGLLEYLLKLVVAKNSTQDRKIFIGWSSQIASQFGGAGARELRVDFSFAIWVYHELLQL